MIRNGRKLRPKERRTSNGLHAQSGTRRRTQVVSPVSWTILCEEVTSTNVEVCLVDEPKSESIFIFGSGS